LSYDENTDALEQNIDKAYLTTTSKLVNLITSKFGLWDHLQAFKKYILLGQGDFIALLIESIGYFLLFQSNKSDDLDRPANSLNRYELTAPLESAIRGSLAQFDPPEILRRLDARMLELSHGEIGWDVFTLEYKVDAPLDAIVTSECAKQYLKVFNFLWRVKRVEFAITGAWRRAAIGARGVLAGVEDIVGKDWKRVRGRCAEMIHFLCQLQYYILFEVIFPWNVFVILGH
jgi:gamma-tubulin complex component 3